MKNKQQEQAKELYFQTNMSKTEIAQQVGVSRRTVLRWCSEDSWEKLRQSSRHLPALVAEKCYYIIDIYTSRILQDPSLYPLTLKDAQAIHLLATSIKKLKNRSTINESMEMFNFFLDGLKKKNPALAEQVMPEMEEYIEARRSRDTNDFLPDNFNENGTMQFPEKEILEHYEDAKDLEALDKEIHISPDYEEALKRWEAYTSAQNADIEQYAPENHTLGHGGALSATDSPKILKMDNVPHELVV